MSSEEFCCIKEKRAGIRIIKDKAFCAHSFFIGALISDPFLKLLTDLLARSLPEPGNTSLKLSRYHWCLSVLSHACFYSSVGD